MPMIDFAYPAGALDPEARDEAVERLTRALLRNEGGVDNDATRAMSRAFVHELPGECMFVGGRLAAQPTYRIVLTVPEGTLLGGPGPVGTASRRTLVREVTEIILEAEDTAYSAAEAARVFCLVHEVADGFWGGLGTTFRVEDIVALANPDAPQTELGVDARRTLEEASAAGLTAAWQGASAVAE